MPRGDKSSTPASEERKADHIAKGYEKRGVSEDEAERRAWASVNKTTAAEEVRLGRGKRTGRPAAHKGGRLGGEASPARPASAVQLRPESGRNSQAACFALTRRSTLMSSPVDPRQEEEKARKKPGNLQHQNPPKKTSTDNPERSPCDLEITRRRQVAGLVMKKVSPSIRR